MIIKYQNLHKVYINIYFYIYIFITSKDDILLYNSYKYKHNIFYTKFHIIYKNNNQKNKELY